MVKKWGNHDRRFCSSSLRVRGDFSDKKSQFWVLKSGTDLRLGCCGADLTMYIFHALRQIAHRSRCAMLYRVLPRFDRTTADDSGLALCWGRSHHAAQLARMSTLVQLTAHQLPQCGALSKCVSCVRHISVAVVMHIKIQPSFYIYIYIYIYIYTHKKHIVHHYIFTRSTFKAL